MKLQPRASHYALIMACLCLIVSNYQAACAQFPEDFAWGASTSAYQIEGAWNISGKGLSWCDWWNLYADLPENQTGNVAVDFYHRFREDINLMKKIGLKNFRMSISWARILPNGTTDYVNPEGVEFYNNVFDALKEAGIEPWVTLYHGDLPQALNWPNATGSWLNPEMPKIFAAYAEFCFKNFGDRVKNWITVNEPAIIAWFGYGGGNSVPLRCSPSYNDQCAKVGGGGNSSTEPYLVTKNIILSHAQVVQTYRNKYKAIQGGQVGYTLNIDHALPWNVSDPNDVAAVDTYLQFSAGWYISPVVYGEYPKIMQEYITGGRLPAFNESEVELIKGAYDFIGINHYTTVYAQYTGKVGSDYMNDSRVATTVTDINGDIIGPQGESDWLYSYPPGIRGISNWISKNYGNPPLVVLENGFDVKGESALPVVKAIADTKRIDYLNGYIDNVVAAVVEDGVNMKGYFVWAWMDNFEWGSFYPRFGLVYVDYDHNMTRIPKASALFYIEKTKKIGQWARGKGSYPSLGFESKHLIQY